MYAQDIEEHLGVPVRCVAIENLKPADVDFGPDNKRPGFDCALELYTVRSVRPKPSNSPCHNTESSIEHWRATETT